MSEELKNMSEKNLFVRICIGTVNLKNKTYQEMEKLIALYLGMNWVNIEESNEILVYAKSHLE